MNKYQRKFIFFILLFVIFIYGMFKGNGLNNLVGGVFSAWLFSYLIDDIFGKLENEKEIE